MWGTIFNAGMIILGSGLGLLFKKGLKPAYHQTLLQALGLCVILLGISTASTSLQKSSLPVLFIVSLTVGSLLGQALRLEERFETLTKNWAQLKLVGRSRLGSYSFALVRFRSLDHLKPR